MARSVKVGFESEKSYDRRCEEGFWDRFAQGPVVLDIGYRGFWPDAVPILPHAIGIELGYPGYDGFNLPFGDGSVDCVHSSHVLEHVQDAHLTLKEWFRVLRVGGHLITFVPHAYLYERSISVPPSRWSGEHLRCYTPGSLLSEIEGALSPNSYRVVHLRDNDYGYDYGLPVTEHPTGCLEIECVIQKIEPPLWGVLVLD
jgi:SAM-dependent methyltransferase